MDTKIFATRSDLMVGLERIESQKDLHYAIAGLYTKDEVIELEILDSLLNVKGIGYTISSQYIAGTQFLVVESKYKIKTEKIKQIKGVHKGKYLYNVGPLKNSHSIIFLPNGIYQDNYLVRGSIGTVSESKKSIELYNFFSKGIIKGFTKIKGWYVGPEAMKFAESGVRLITMHAQQSPEYDLSID
ncbi:MAG: hypothetical protein FVQ79_04970 [Planctomycetes bacterium]|nr:hypothetical protein [Planctomycetota bacterium]